MLVVWHALNNNKQLAIKIELNTDIALPIFQFVQ
jgi:hypothetical protein